MPFFIFRGTPLTHHHSYIPDHELLFVVVMAISISGIRFSGGGPYASVTQAVRPGADQVRIKNTPKYSDLHDWFG